MLNLLTGGTIRSPSTSSEAKLIELEDPQLQDELNKALTALAQARDQDKKPVTIHFSGEGERRVRIGYVVETPVWKTSYRLILLRPGRSECKAKADKPKLQGWAIVENQTDNDWNNVQLSLVSGRPICFIQDLYQPALRPAPGRPARAVRQPPAADLRRGDGQGQAGDKFAEAQATPRAADAPAGSRMAARREHAQAAPPPVGDVRAASASTQRRQRLAEGRSHADGRHRVRRLPRLGRQGRRAVPVHRRQRLASRASSRP